MSELPFADLDEDSFQTLMYELEHGLLNYNFENLVNLSFNPFANTVNQSFPLTSGLGQDANLYLTDNDWSHYVENDFNRLLKKEKYHSFVFSILHHNIHSLTNNLPHFTDYLNNINMQFLVISNTETRLKDSSHFIDINGYTFVHHCRNDKRRGGTGLYILKNIQFKVRNNLVINNNVIAKSTFVEI